MQIWIFDLDKTLTDRASFTGFLCFAARWQAPWRLALLPLWGLLMLGYRIGLYDRTTLKRRGMMLMVGRAQFGALDRMGHAFAEKLFRHVQSGARRLWDEAGAAGHRRVIATAAFAFYADPFGAMLDADQVIATPFTADGHIPGGNNYGATKLARVEQWFAEQSRDRADLHIVAASDSFADAPLLDWADEALFVTRNANAGNRALACGWKPTDLSN